MDEFIASRDERESALAAASALRDSEARSLAEEHYIQNALHKAFGRLLATATDKVTAIVLDEMASKNAKIYALRNCLDTWRDMQAAAQEAASDLQGWSTPLDAKQLGVVFQILAKTNKDSQAYAEAWQLARLIKFAYFETRFKAEAMKTFRTWYRCTKTYQEIMSMNYDKIQILKAIKANIMMKIKFRQAWTNWSGMDTYDIEESIVYIRDDVQSQGQGQVKRPILAGRTEFGEGSTDPDGNHPAKDPRLDEDRRGRASRSRRSMS